MHLSDLQIDQALLRGASQPTHLTECERCRLRWEELSRGRQQFSERARPAAFADAVLARRRPRLRWWWGLAPALAVLAVIVWPRDGVREKGAPVAVELYVKSDGHTARFEPERRYHAGDALQVVYTSSRPWHLTALDVDGERVSILAHDHLEPGTRRRLDRSFVLDQQGGDEQVLLLFSERPLAEAEAKRAAQGGDVPLAAQARFLIHR